MKWLRNNRGSADLREMKKELELSAVPDIVNEKLKMVYAELPEELPTGRRNYAGAWRRSVCCAACLLLACCMLFGLNAFNPAFAESIPGLGSLFSLMNGHTMHPMGGNLGTYGERVQKLGLEIPDSENSGYGLSVEDAFCDGEYLYATMKISCPEEAEQYESVSFGCDGKSDFHFLLNGQELEKVSSGGDVLGENEAAALVYRLPQPAEDGSELKVSLQVGELWGIFPDYKSQRKADRINVGFSADFSVTADTTQNSTAALSAEDNGVRLYSVERTPGYIRFDMEIPFWGRTGDELLNGGPALGYVMLFTEDGRELRHNSKLMDYDFANEENKERIRETWAFDGPGLEDEKVILRVLDRSPSSYSSVTMEKVQPIVFAEFTVDWKKGTATPSKTYESLDYEKVETEEYLAREAHADFTGGYFIQDICHTTDVWHGQDEAWVCAVQLVSDCPDPTGAQLRFYAQGELVGTVKSAPQEDYNDEIGGGWKTYRTESGFFCAMPAGEETEQDAQWNLLFVCYDPEDWEKDEHGIPTQSVDRIDLVDSETGEILLENVRIGDTYRP